MPNFRSKQESFLQACRGTSRESDAAGGEKAVKDALQRVLRHALKRDGEIEMDIVSYREQDQERLVQIWERAVRATHSFLEEQHIQFYRDVVSKVLQERQVEVWETLDKEHQPVGFIGLQDNFIEMLFVDPSQHGQGVGRLLIEHTVKIKGRHLKVDVNEQNPGAAQFYSKMGFVQIGRSEFDGSGNPFPLLHLEIS